MNRFHIHTTSENRYIDAERYEIRGAFIVFIRDQATVAIYSAGTFLSAYAA